METRVAGLLSERQPLGTPTGGPWATALEILVIPRDSTPKNFPRNNSVNAPRHGPRIAAADAWSASSAGGADGPGDAQCDPDWLRTSGHLARISHTIERIGAPNQRK